MVKNCKHISLGFRHAAAADANLWTAVCLYLNEWRDETTISWVKSHAEDGGAKTNNHKEQNQKADDDAEKAYAHPDSDEYGEGCCSQFNMIWGATIEDTVVVHKAGATILRHLQKAQYLRYWKTRGRGRWLGGERRHRGARSCV